MEDLSPLSEQVSSAAACASAVSPLAAVVTVAAVALWSNFSEFGNAAALSGHRSGCEQWYKFRSCFRRGARQRQGEGHACSGVASIYFCIGESARGAQRDIAKGQGPERDAHKAEDAHASPPAQTAHLVVLSFVDGNRDPKYRIR